MFGLRYRLPCELCAWYFFRILCCLLGYISNSFFLLVIDRREDEVAPIVDTCRHLLGSRCICSGRIEEAQFLISGSCSAPPQIAHHRRRRGFCRRHAFILYVLDFVVFYV